MVLIGIVGASGTGKSTTSKIFKEKIDDCITINLDDYMRKHWESHKQQILSALNISEVNKDNWHSLIIKNRKDIEIWAEIIGDDLEKDIRGIIEENNNFKVVILDWAFLPLFPIYNECDFSVFVKCDLDTRLHRLTKRMKEKGKFDKWDNESLLNRLKNTCLDEWGYSSTYTISNNGNLEELEKQVGQILNIYSNNDLIFK